MESQIKFLNDQLRNKKVSAQELLTEAVNQLEAYDEQLKIFVSKTLEQATLMAAGVTATDLESSLVAGIPTALKDNFNWTGTKTTASSKMLANYISPYNATVTERMLQNKSVIVGKTNMDAFAHGSSTATSDFFVTRNPRNPDYYPGGSSGGSAAAVAAGVVPYAIGSETAGSIRLPASWCGVVGVTPTYGRLSRYGVVAMGSSLDRPGVFANAISDCAIVIDSLSGHDPLDATNRDLPKTNFYGALTRDIKGLKIGLPKAYWDSRIDPEILAKVKQAVAELEKLGAVVKEVDLLDPKYSIAVYTIVCRSEVSSNLARLDGLRYGYHTDEYYGEVLDQVAHNRWEGMGAEAKQRSMTGAYTLSAGYYDAYYKKAQQVRYLIKQDLEKALAEVDVIIAPTTPTTAIKVGDPQVDSPLFGELSDVLLETSALSGNPSLSIPVGNNSSNMPIGMQIVSKQWDEQTMLNVAHAYESR